MNCEFSFSKTDYLTKAKNTICSSAERNHMDSYLFEEWNTNKDLNSGHWFHFHTITYSQTVNLVETNIYQDSLKYTSFMIYKHYKLMKELSMKKMISIKML